MSFVVAAFYHFTPLEPAEHRDALRSVAEDAGVRGTILLAPEGVNGTIAGTREGIDRVLAALRALPGCAPLDWKESTAAEQPFRRLKVRLKREIVTLGVEGVDPTRKVGTYVAPEDWNTVVDDPDTVVIDTRNDYEVAIGTFEGAVDPETESFRAFPDWWQKNRARFEGKRVAMFCTGGIRCEKASSYLLGEGVPEVLHLKGGILKYLETVPAEKSRWNGECFVFDGRVSVGHGLAEGEHELCHACGRAVSPADREHPDYREGISCAACIGEYTAADRERFAERQLQTRLARSRGEAHLAED
ncbi:rhodanese-related sulfurtransferase [Rhodobacteraceae bacterium NNCM2]|nr:rhodanese-related sulfurtransferase [Coraliihabitans acroporae]